MAWGISPKVKVQVSLGDFATNKYLAIVFQALNNLGWKVSYADDHGLIAYTPISWESYSEQITVVIKNGTAHIKSECVGYQGFLFDYGKNEKNIELLITEIEYAGFHFKADEAGNIEKFRSNFYQHPGINLEYTPLGAKDRLTNLLTIFVPKKNYQIVPWLIIINCFIFLIQRVLLAAFIVVYQKKYNGIQSYSDYYVRFSNTLFGGIERNMVLNGDYWRLLAACFSHVSFSHLFFNMIFLAYIGSILEGRVGKWNFLGLYIMTGICASLASIGYRYEGMGIGASGAIMGLFGVFLAYLSTNFFDKKARAAFLISTIIISIITLFPTENKTDHAAHFGGFISGYIFGIFSYWAYTKPEKRKRLVIRSLSYVIIFAVAISSLLFIPRYDLPKYRQSLNKVYNNLNRISAYFYSPKYRYIPEEEKTLLLEREMLPIISENKRLLAELKTTPLPEEEYLVNANYMIFYEKKLQIYELLYKEYKTGDTKYRKEIERLTAETNKLKN